MAEKRARTRRPKVSLNDDEDSAVKNVKSRRRTTTTVKKRREPRRLPKEEESDWPADEDIDALVAPLPAMPTPADHSERYSPEVAFNAVKAYIPYLQKTLTDKKLALPQHCIDQWQRDIDELKRTCVPRTVIAVVGATGSGKSSLINALLDQPQICAPNGMRAYTAVVTEISYHEKNYIQAEVEFLQPDEWKKDLELLLVELLNGNGRVQEEEDDEPEEVAVARAKFTAVYPEIPLDTLPGFTVEALMQTGIAARVLGKKETFSSDTCTDFSIKIAPYVGGEGPPGNPEDFYFGEPDENAPQYWPLVKVLRIRVKSQILATGATLVDLPGTQDTNAARSKIAKDYLERADAIWIVAPVTRAVSDKSAKDLVGQAFKKQLLMDCSYNENVITFICSKTDDIHPSGTIEDIRHLKQDRELQGVSKSLKALEEKMKQDQEQLAEVKTHIRALKAQYDQATLEHEHWKRRHQAVQPDSSRANKRRSNSNTSLPLKRTKLDVHSFQSQNAGTRFSILPASLGTDCQNADNSADHDLMDETAKNLSRSNSACALLNIKLKAKYVQEQQIEQNLTNHTMSSKIVAKRRAAICSLARNEWCKKVIRKNFRKDLKEREDTIAESVNPDNFDPEAARRDYSPVDLSVFCVSANEYRKIAGLEETDVETAVFTSEAETGIPQLQEHTRNVTWAGRSAAAIKAIELLLKFTGTVQVYLHTNGRVRSHESEEMCAVFAQEATILMNAMDALVSLKIDVLKKEMVRVLRHKIIEGIRRAERDAVTTVDEFGESIPWNTYRATMRREGSYKEDLNELLIQPIIDEAAYAWRNSFEAGARAAFGDLSRLLMECAEQAFDAIEERAPVALQPRLHAIRRQQHHALVIGFKHLADAANIKINTLQKRISRQISPDVRAQLSETYLLAGMQTGRGLFKHMKELMHERVASSNHAVAIFGCTAEVVIDRLYALGDKLQGSMKEDLDRLGDAVRHAYGGAWEDMKATPEQIQLRRAVRERSKELSARLQDLLAAAKEADRTTRPHHGA